MDIIKKNSNLTFLVCSERSGSNLITKLMNNHSQICGPSTKHIINPLARNYFRYQPFSVLRNWESLLKDIIALYNVSFSIWKSEFTIEELKENVPQGDLNYLIKYIFLKEVNMNNKQHVFIKEIKPYEFYPFLKHYFPKAKFVHLYRDPRDMALSWKKNPSHKGGIVAAARQWKNDQQQYLKIKALEEENQNIVSLSYEELVSNTSESLVNILNLFNLEFEPSMLEMGRDELTDKNAKQQRAWENISKPVMTDNFNKYKSELSDIEIQYIEAICYFEMKYLGYKPENDWVNLDAINPSTISDYNQKEMSTLEYNPTSGVKNNMEAKKAFYQNIS